MVKRKKKTEASNLAKLLAKGTREHMEQVEPAIRKLDRQAAIDAAQAPFIVVTNETHS